MYNDLKLFNDKGQNPRFQQRFSYSEENFPALLCEKSNVHLFVQIKKNIMTMSCKNGCQPIIITFDISPRGFFPMDYFIENPCGIF